MYQKFDQGRYVFLARPPIVILYLIEDFILCVFCALELIIVIFFIFDVCALKYKYVTVLQLRSRRYHYNQ